MWLLSQVQVAVRRDLADFIAGIYAYLLRRTYGRVFDLCFGFGVFSGQTGPQDRLKRARLEKWCRTHLNSAPETNYNAIS